MLSLISLSVCLSIRPSVHPSLPPSHMIWISERWSFSGDVWIKDHRKLLENNSETSMWPARICCLNSITLVINLPHQCPSHVTRSAFAEEVVKANESEYRAADFGAGIKMKSYTKVFIAVEEKKTWEQAQESCKKIGGRLATFPDAEEEKNVMEWLDQKSPKFYWIGLTFDKSTKKWFWGTGQEMQFDRSYAYNETPVPWPYIASEVESCAQFETQYGFSAKFCSSKDPFICERRDWCAWCKQARAGNEMRPPAVFP